jgi:hypothetical protein
MLAAALLSTAAVLIGSLLICIRVMISTGTKALMRRGGPGSGRSTT